MFYLCMSVRKTLDRNLNYLRFLQVFIYWLCSLSCDTLSILDTMMIMPYTTENGKFAWERQTVNCTQETIYYTRENTTQSNTEFIKVPGKLL